MIIGIIVDLMKFFRININTIVKFTLKTVAYISTDKTIR